MSKLIEQRIDNARGIAIRNRLISAGMDPEVAERWCDAWEAEAALRDLKRNADYWETSKLWIDAQCAARKTPPSSTPPQRMDRRRRGGVASSARTGMTADELERVLKRYPGDV